MSKVKLLGIAAIVLFVSNIALAGFILMDRGRHPRPEGPKKEIIEKLKFDENQVNEYEKLIQLHRQEIGKTQDEIILAKNELYSNLTKDNSAQLTDSLVYVLGNLQEKIERIHYRHFQELKKLCKEDQQLLFEELVKELAKLFSPRMPGVNKK